MKLKLKMPAKILAKIKKCLVLVIIQLSQNTTMIRNVIKCFNDSMNSIQSQDHGTETYEIIKISLSCFDDKSKTMNIMN